jgi:hypothetical protein
LGHQTSGAGGAPIANIDDLAIIYQQADLCRSLRVFRHYRGEFCPLQRAKLSVNRKVSVIIRLAGPDDR